MSRAFVKEQDGGDADAELPDRSISPHRNLVTAEGLAAIEAEIASLRTALAEADVSARGALARDLRYWTARRASAELTELPPGEETRFGSRVTISRADGVTQSFRIVGEDEADPASGTLSHVAPLARILMGKGAGDEVAFRGEAIRIVSVGSS